MDDSSTINIRGEWYCGISLKTRLTADMLPADDIVCQIETKIKTMRSLYDEFLVVDLQNQQTADRELPIYFQMLRNRNFGMTNAYHLELGMKSERGIIHYIKDAVSLEEALDLFKKICVYRVRPESGAWKIGTITYCAGNNEDEIRQLGYCERFLSKYWQNKIGGIGVEFAEYDAWEYVVENNSDAYYTCEIAREYERRGLYAKLRRLFEMESFNPVIAQINGEMALHGVFGKPDYKTAYEYFMHAKTVGSLLAEYYIAKMYQYGLYVETDYAEYERLIRMLYEKYQNNMLECCPRQVFLEMSKIEQRAGNIGKAIEYCIIPIKTQRTLMRVGFGNITDADREIVNRLYELIEFDYDDMDLLDLLYVFNKPSKVRIAIGNKQLTVQAFHNEGKLIVKCGKSYYRDATFFLQKHKIKDKLLATYIYDVDYMEVL